MTDQLGKSPLARFLDSGDLEVVRPYMREVRGLEGVLIEQGAMPRALYFLSEGSVEVRSAERRMPLTQLDAPQVFGEMAFLTGGVASATVGILQSVSGVEIEFEKMREMLKARPDVGVLVMTFLARTLAHRLATTNRHLKQVERETRSERLGLSTLEDSELDDGFSAEFASVNLDEVWDASFEL